MSHAGTGSTVNELRSLDPDDRSAIGLPSHGFVFANFNKNEKLEPVAFGVWMAVLRRVPGSVLWLLNPVQSIASGTQLQNLLREAAAAGVAPSRIVFAQRYGRCTSVFEPLTMGERVLSVVCVCLVVPR